jgi:hypothetical protein
VTDSRPIPHYSLDPQLRHAVSSCPGTTVVERTLTRHSFFGVNDPRLAGAICPARDPFIAFKDIPRNKEGRFFGIALCHVYHRVLCLSMSTSTPILCHLSNSSEKYCTQTINITFSENCRHKQKVRITVRAFRHRDCPDR